MSAARRWLAALTVAGVLASSASAPVPVAHADEALLTASFAGVPSAHDGVSPFSFDLVFSEPPSVSYAALRDDSFDVTGATVTGARRIDGRSDLWEITVAPDVASVTDAVADISIELPVTSDCGDEGAVCTAGDVKALSNSTTATVAAPPPLVAEFEGVPATHDTSAEFSFRLRFSTAVTTSYRILDSTAFDVTGGEVSDARRIDGRSDLWQITIQPDTVDDDTVDDDITITLPVTEDCTDADAVCTAALRPLSEPVTAAVEGPLVEAEQNTEGGQRVTRGVPGDKEEEEDRVGVRALPGRPGSLEIQGGNEQVTVSWDEVTSDPAVTAYVVEYRVGDSGPYTMVSRGDVLALSETITGRTNYERFRVQVYAVNDEGSSATRGTTAMAVPTVPLASANAHATDISGTDMTLWVADTADNKSYAYTKATGARNSSLDFVYNTEHVHAAGQCLLDGFFWIADSDDDHIYAYNKDTRAHDTTKSFDLHMDNANPRGVACHDGTIWVADSIDKKMYAYGTDGARDSDSDITLHSSAGVGNGAWTDGTTVWISDTGGRLRAYDVATGAELTNDYGIASTTVAGLASPSGVWSDGTDLWITDVVDNLFYKFELPQRAAAVAPGVPTSVASVGGSDGSVTVTWEAPASDGGTAITSYDLRYKKTADDDVVASWTTETQSDPSTRSLTISALDLGVSYDVQVRADNGTDGEWSASATAETGHDFELDTTRPYDLTSDGTTVWVTDGTTRTIKAYSLSNGALDEDKNFTTVVANNNPTGICWHTDTFWVAQSGGTNLYAYNNDGTPNSDRDIALPTGTDPRGLSCTDRDMQVVDDTTDKYLVYFRNHLGTDELWVRSAPDDVDPSGDSGSDDPIGVWSADSGSTFVSDVSDTQVYAHIGAAFGGYRLRYLEFDLVSANDEPAGMWSDGTTMWVLDRGSQVAYGYRLPLGTDGGPAPLLAIVQADRLSAQLAFNENLDRNVTPAAGAFEVTAGSDMITPSSIAHSVDEDSFAVEDSVTLTFSPALPAGETLTIAYTAPTSTDPAIQDAGGVAAESFSGFKVINRPSAPQNVAAAPGDTSLTVTWEAPAGNGGKPLTSYRVRYKLSTATTWTTVTRSDVLALTETITGLTNDLEYDIEVIASNYLRGAAAEVSATPAAPSTTTSVPKNWRLKPAGLGVGDQFRLLFVSSTTRSATTSQLSVYDTSIQAYVGSGHAAVRSYSSQFEVLGSSSEGDARDHTETTFTATEKGVPIYYLGGAKVADDYEDFYDGSWDSHSPTNQLGEDSSANRVWTGTDGDGTVSGRGFGANNPNSVTLGDPTSSTADWVLNRSFAARNSNYPLYGLSSVFEVSSTAVAATVASVAVTSTPVATSDTYGAGEVIQFTVTFTHEVEVSTDRPHFEFSLGGTDTDAAYQGGSGTTELTFAYTVLAAADDDNGIWIGDQSRTIKFDSGEYIHTVGGDDLDAILTHATLGAQASHKVDGSLTPTIDAVPAAPTGVTAAAGNKSLVVGWSAVTATPVVTGYKIQYRVTGTDAWTAWTGTIAATATSETVTGVSEWVSYDVQVLAVNSEGDGAWSDSVAGTAHRDVTLSAAGSVDGLASDGTTLWATVPGSNIASAYTLSDGTADTTKNITFASGTAPTGICAAHSKVWVAQSNSLSLQAYDTDGTRQDGSDVALPTGTNPVALWCSADFLFVAHDDTVGGEDAVLAYIYDSDSFGRFAPYDVTGLAAADNADPAGLVLSGTVVLVSDAMDDKTYAYNLISARNLLDMEVDFGTDVGTAAGIWADSATLWAADTDAASEIDSFRLPQPADGAPDVWNAEMTPDAGTELQVGYSELLDGGVIPPTARFTVMAGSTQVTVSSVAHLDDGDGPVLSSMLLTLGSELPTGATVTLSYTDPNPGSNDATGVVQDLDGNDAPSFSGYRVWTPPGQAPAGMSAVPGDAQLALSWDAVADTARPGDTSYVVQYKRSTITNWMTASAANTQTARTIAGLTNGWQYDVRVRASNASGAGPYSVVVSATPSAGPLVEVEAGSADSTFKATDNKSGSTTWHYAWIAGTAVCDSTATFPSASNYNEGADLAYTSTQNTNKACFRSTEGTNSGYAVSEVVNTNAASSDATLSALTLMEGSNSVTLTPVFASATTAYRAWVANGVSSVTVTATKNDSEASVAITDDTDTSTPNTAVLLLEEGANTITVTVTAADTTTTGTYTITAVREASAPTADPTALLTAKMTAAQSGTADIYGYQPFSGTEGALTDSDFDYNGATYTITRLYWNGPSGLAALLVNRLFLCLSSLPSNLVYDLWTLRIGSVDYSLDGRNRVGSTQCVSWPRTDAWAHGDVVTVKMFGNHEASGAPGVSGTAQVGRTLTASTSGIADLDGKTKADDGESGFAYGYQWVRVDSDGTNPQNILGATSVTYVPVKADVGKRVMVEVSFTDDRSNEEELTSAAYPAAGRILNDVPPMLDTATVNGVSLVLTYDRELDGDYDPAVGSYTVAVAGTEVTPTGVDAAGRTVTLTLGTAVTSGQSVTLDYRVPAMNPVQDSDGTPAGALDGQAVHNVVGDTTVPTLDSAQVDGDVLVLSYSEALDSGSEPAVGQFDVQVTPSGGSASRRTVSTVDVSGSKVTLTLVSAVDVTDSVTLDYNKPTSNPLQDVAGNDAAALDDQAVISNNLPMFAQATLTREITENSAANVNVGAVIPAATGGADGTTLVYSMEGTDAASFNFNVTTRQITTKTGVTYDYEDKTSYEVTIKVTDGTDNDTVTVTINVKDLPGFSIAPTYERILLSDGRVQFTLTPDTSPAAEVTRVDYTVTQDEAWLAAANLQGVLDHLNDGASTVNNRSFKPDAPARSGNVTFTLQPGDGYELGATTSATVAIVADDPLITVRATQAAVAVDEDGGTVTVTLRAETIAGVPRPRPPDSPPHRTNWVATGDTATGGGADFGDAGGIALFFEDGFTDQGGRWVATRDVQVTVVDDDTWELDETFHVALSREATLHRLVKLANEDGTLCVNLDADEICGATVTIRASDNAAPVFSNSSEIRAVAENSRADTDVGAPVTATDADTGAGDALTYSLEGADAASFAVDASTGQITTVAGVDYDFEADPSYSVTVKATDLQSASVTVAVTINLIDVAVEVDVCAAPDLAGREQVWTSVLTVGSRNAGLFTLYGFDGGSNSYGSLSDDDFRVGSTTYDVSTLFSSVGGFIDGQLTFDVESVPDRGAVLHVCDESFALADAVLERTGGEDTYTWQNTGLDWSGVDERTVYLSVTPPQLDSATVNGTQLKLEFSRTLDMGSVPSNSDFNVQVTPEGGVAARRSVTDVAISASTASTATLTLVSAVLPEDTVTVQYSGQALRDTTAIKVRAFDDFEQVDNDTPDTTAPLLESNTVSGSTLSLTYNEALDEGSVPAPGAFVVNVAPTGGTAQRRDVTVVVVDGVIVRLTLVSPVAPGDTVTLVYTVPGSNPVQDQSGNDAAAIDITIELLADQTGRCNRDLQDRGLCDLGTATTLAPGVSLEAAVAKNNDVDWFRVELVEDKVYRVDMEGAPTGRGTLRDPYLRGMFAVFAGPDVRNYQADGSLDGGGEDIETIWYSLHGDCAAGERDPSTDCELFDEGTYYNDDGGVGYNARLYLRDFPTGAHYLEARGLGPATGTYTITLTEVTDDAEGARTLDLSTQTSAVIDFPGDTDAFTVDLTADTEYTITLRSQGWDGWSRIDIDTAHHNSAPGIRVDTPYDGSTGTYTITPATTGTHTLRIIGRNWGRHQRFATGDYTITITG